MAFWYGNKSVPRWWLESHRRIVLPPKVFQRAPDLLRLDELNELKQMKPKRVGGAKAKLRYRGLNKEKEFRGRRSARIRGTKHSRGWFRFRMFYPDWTPITIDDQDFVEAENSNAAAKKVITALKQAGVINVGDPDYTDFYLTSQAEINPDNPRRTRFMNRTRFYHYEGRFIPRPRTVRRGRTYDVDGVAEVHLFEGERFSVPYWNPTLAQDAINKVLRGETSIRSIQRQSMIDTKSKRKRKAFIQYKLHNPNNPQPPPRQRRRPRGLRRVPQQRQP